MKRKRIIKLSVILLLCSVLLYFFYKANLYSPMKQIFSSPQAFKEFILEQGSLAPVIFLLMQIAQTIISPIPGNLIALAGGSIFGGLTASLLSSSGIIIGSIIAFYMARFFGKPLVIKLIGEPVYNKYSSFLTNKGTTSLLILFFLPFFPDDAFCFLAGLSKLPSKLFLILVIIGRPPGIIFASLAGAGIINLPPYAWIIIAAASLFAIVISIRYSKFIEEWIYSRLNLEKS